MERDVYVADFGGLTQLTAVDERGVLRQVTIRTELYQESDLEYLRRWLERVSPTRGGALRLV